MSRPDEIQEASAAAPPSQKQPAEAQVGQTEPSTPGWVKVFGLLALLFFVTFMIVHLLGGGLGAHMSHHGDEHPQMKERR